MLAAKAEGFLPFSLLTGETLEVLPADNQSILGGDIRFSSLAAACAGVILLLVPPPRSVSNDWCATCASSLNNENGTTAVWLWSILCRWCLPTIVCKPTEELIRFLGVARLRRFLRDTSTVVDTMVWDVVNIYGSNTDAGDTTMIDRKATTPAFVAVWLVPTNNPTAANASWIST